MKTNNLEIERKWLIKDVPAFIMDNLYHYEKLEISQSYISFLPHIRIRQENDKYILNFKRTLNNTDLTRKEIEIEITKEEYNNLFLKKEGITISKTRYIIPIEDGLKIELDYFHNDYHGLIYAEVEFPSEEKAKNFIVPFWFYKELTGIKEYNNMNLAKNYIPVERIYT